MIKFRKLRHFFVAAIIILGLFSFFVALPKNAASAKTASANQQTPVKTAKKPVAKKPIKKAVVKKKVIAKKSVAKKKGIGNGQCVHYARYLTGLKFRGNAITWKRHINSRTPIKGAVVVFNYGRLGHVAVVNAINGDKITISEQNYYGPHIISTRLVSSHDPKILGYVAKPA